MTEPLTHLDDRFWNRLLKAIEEGQLVPVIGSQLLAWNDQNKIQTLQQLVAMRVLMHPLISHLQGIPLLGTKLGDTIHREEFTKLLMDMAAGNNFGLDKNAFTDSTKDKLKGMLKNNGIDDLATKVRHNIALMQEANRRLVANINSWFDQTMDRESDRFTASTRVVTVVCTLIVVATAQLDTLDVINRLSMDDKLRETLVVKAIKVDEAQHLSNTSNSDDKDVSAFDPQANTPEKAKPIAKAAGNQPSTLATQSETTDKSTDKKQTESVNIQSVKEDLKTLEDLGLINIIGNGKINWWEHWCEVNPVGILLSVVLVSLGAPFWYGALKDLLKLRSALAGQDDQQRQERQTTQPSEQTKARPNPTTSTPTIKPAL